MKYAQQATRTPLESNSSASIPDTVNALVLNKKRESLIFELPRQTGSGVYWQMLSLEFNPEDDPFTAVQTALLHKTGYQTSHWSYLGTHIISQEQPARVGYYFCAQQAHQIASPHPNGSISVVAKWVSLTDLRYALLDGRILLATHALTASLALLNLRK